MDDKALEILLAVKDDVAGTREAVARVEGQMSRLPCGVHLVEIQHLRAEVATIKEKDIPELRQHFAVLDWFKKGRNKTIAALLAALLGLAGSVVGSLLLKQLAPDPVPAAAAAPMPVQVPAPVFDTVGEGR